MTETVVWIDPKWREYDCETCGGTTSARAMAMWVTDHGYVIRACRACLVRQLFDLEGSLPEVQQLRASGQALLERDARGASAVSATTTLSDLPGQQRVDDFYRLKVEIRNLEEELGRKRVEFDLLPGRAGSR